jgi:dTDP-4-dehydrorhamnose 3,5-epimerase
MIFTPTPIAGAMVIDLEPRSDDRGFFSRSYCADEFAAAGIDHEVVQENVSFNLLAGTCRGIHFQRPPHAEAKLVRCTAGAIFDVVVDLRPESNTFGHWHGVELTAENRTALYVPKRCGHAYLTLTDGAEVTYQVSQRYNGPAEGGLQPEDPSIAIAWPIPPRVVSPKDAAWPSFTEQRHDLRATMQDHSPHS